MNRFRKAVEQGNNMAQYISHKLIGQYWSYEDGLLLGVNFDPSLATRQQKHSPYLL
jgi:hypothetical protein